MINKKKKVTTVTTTTTVTTSTTTITVEILLKDIYTNGIYDVASYVLMILEMPLIVSTDPKRPRTSHLLTVELRQLCVFHHEMFVDLLEMLGGELAERAFPAVLGTSEMLEIVAANGVVAGFAVEALAAKAAAVDVDFLLLGGRLVLVAEDDDVRG